MCHQGKHSVLGSDSDDATYFGPSHIHGDYADS